MMDSSLYFVNDGTAICISPKVLFVLVIYHSRAHCLNISNNILLFHVLKNSMMKVQLHARWAVWERREKYGGNIRNRSDRHGLVCYLFSQPDDPFS